MSKKLGLENKYKALKPNYLQYPVITSVKPNVTGKMGGGMMMKYKTGKAVTLSPKQKKIAAMAGNPNKIDAPDFEKLRSMKANKGVFANIMKPGKMEGEKAYLKRLKETGTSAEKKAYGYLKAMMKKKNV